MVNIFGSMRIRTKAVLIVGAILILTLGITTGIQLRVFTTEMFGEGYYEGSGVKEESHKGVTKDENITQIFKTAYKMSNTARNIRYAGGDEWTRKKARKARQHALDLEQTFLFQGEYDIDDPHSDSPRRRTRGLGIGKDGTGTTPFNAKTDIGFIKTFNVDLIGGSTHADNALLVQNSSTTFFDHLDDVAELVFEDLQTGSMEKVWFGSAKWATILSQAGREHNSYQWIPGQYNASFGIVVNQFVTPHGTINFVKHPVFRGYYDDYCVSLDFANIDYKFVPGRDTHIVPNAQSNDADAYMEYLLTECGLEVRHEQTHAIMKLYD